MTSPMENGLLSWRDPGPWRYVVGWGKSWKCFDLGMVLPDYFFE
jgi:hypothetical protein